MFLLYTLFWSYLLAKDFCPLFTVSVQGHCVQAIGIVWYGVREIELNCKSNKILPTVMHSRGTYKWDFLWDRVGTTHLLMKSHIGHFHKKTNFQTYWEHKFLCQQICQNYKSWQHDTDHFGNVILNLVLEIITNKANNS